MAWHRPARSFGPLRRLPVRRSWPDRSSIAEFWVYCFLDSLDILCPTVNAVTAQADPGLHLFVWNLASAASLPPQLLQLLPAGAKVAGRDSHPLKDSALARRTLTESRLAIRSVRIAYKTPLKNPGNLQ